MKDALNIAKRESKNLLLNPRYTIMVVAISACFSIIIPVFTGFADDFQRGRIGRVSPVLSDYVAASAYNLSAFPEFEEELEKLSTVELVRLKQDSLELLSQRRVAGHFSVSKKLDDYEIRLTLDPGNPKAGLLNQQAQIAAYDAREKLSPTQKTYEYSVAYSSGESDAPIGFAAVINGLLIPSIVLLPVFMWSGAVIDSIVSEKREKTIELLFASPVSKTSILLGKTLATAAVILFMSMFWILLLMAEGIRIADPLGLYVFLNIVGFFLVSLTALVATYSENFKQANLYMTMVTVAMFIAFSVFTLTLYVPKAKLIASLSPITSVSALVSGTAGVPVGMSLGLMLCSSLMLFLAVGLFEDEKTFFGKQTLFSVTENLGKHLSTPFEKKPFLAAAVFLGFGFLATFFAAAAQIVASIILLFTVGIRGVPIMMIVFPYVEELFKLYPIFAFARAREKWFEKKHFAAACGAASGLGFNVAESGILGVIYLAFLPQFLQQVVYRGFLTSLPHAVFTAAGAAVLSRKIREKEFYAVLAAGTLHLAYNMFILYISGGLG